MSYSIFLRERIPYITFAPFILLLMASCGESEHAIQIAKYGEIVNYRTGKSVVYPEFSLQFIKKETIQSDTEGEGVSYSFQLTGGGPNREIAWLGSRNRVGAIDHMGDIDQFEHNGKTYYLELKSSSFLDKPLNDGELIVWTEVQAGKHRENINKVMARIRQKMIEHATRQSEAIDHDTQQKLLTLYKNYMHTINNGNDEQIDSYLVSLPQPRQPGARKLYNARNKQIDRLLSRTNPKWSSLNLQQAIATSETKIKLHMEGPSENGLLTIGATFVKQGRTWRIESDTVLPANAEGNRQIALFMQAQ